MSKKPKKPSRKEPQMVTIVPRPEILSSVSTQLKCTQLGCKSIFKCSANLNMHLVKHHKISDSLAKHNQGSKFVCPVESCKYSLTSNKFFSKIKFLKQHYLKCHAERLFSCKLCSKAFSTESMVRSHEKCCGKKFECSCSWTYNTREALMTHCKRKGHQPLESQKLVVDGAKAACPTKIDNGEENTVVKVCIASPPHSKTPKKPNNDVAVFPTHYIAAIALSELSTTFIIPKNCHIGVQTVDTKIAKRRSPNDKKRKNTQETQTAELLNGSKKQKISAETQTRTHVKKKIALKSSPRKRKKSIETQTKDPMPFLSSVGNESLDGGMFNESSLSNSSAKNEPSVKSLDDDSVWEDDTYNNNTDKPPNRFVTTINSNLFATQNELSIGVRGSDLPLRNFDITKLCNIETQTELDTILQPEGEGTSTTETQTTENLIDDMLYSNMCTQTCDDVSDLFDFNLVDIETQTAWPVL